MTGYNQQVQRNTRGGSNNYRRSNGYHGSRMGESFGNVLLLDAYQAATTRGSRSNLWIIGVLATGYGAVKLTQISGKALTSGARYSLNRVKTKQQIKEQKEREQKQSLELERAASMAPTNQELETPAYALSFIDRLINRLESTPGVSFQYEELPVKKGGNDSKRRVKVTLGKEHTIEVSTMGIFDSDGDTLLEEDLVRSTLLLVSRYPKRYEKGLIILLDEFIKEGKVVY